MVIPTTLDELAQLAQDAMFFGVLDATDEHEQNKDIVKGPMHLFLSNKVLAAIDERLPVLVAGQCALQGTNFDSNTKTIYTVSLIDSVRYLEGCQQLKLTSGEIVHYRMLLSFVDDLVNQESTEVKLMAAILKFEPYTHTDGRIVDVPCNVKIGEFSICAEWLDETYPKWRCQHTVAHTLGYTGPDLIDQTFSPVKSVNIPSSINNVTFEP